jgi:hypothetical protein
VTATPALTWRTTHHLEQENIMEQPFALTNNSDVVAAIPPLLGCVPTDSFIVVLLSAHNTVRCLLRGDIHTDPESAGNLPTICDPTFRNVDTVILVAIGDHTLDHQARTTLDALRDGMRRAGIGIRARIQARDTTHAGQWIDIDTGETGPVYPYTDSILSAAIVHSGRNIAQSREHIVAEFTSTTTNPTPVIAEDPDAIAISTLEEIAATIATNTAAGPTLATRAGILITHNIRLRDAALALGLEHPGPAATLWTTIANQLTGHARLQALTIAAANYYMASDGLRAGIALDVADEDATAAALAYPTLAALLRDALHAGMPPHDIRTVMLRSLSDSD